MDITREEKIKIIMNRISYEETQSSGGGAGSPYMQSTTFKKRVISIGSLAEILLDIIEEGEITLKVEPKEEE